MLTKLLRTILGTPVVTAIWLTSALFFNIVRIAMWLAAEDYHELDGMIQDSPIKFLKKVWK